MAAKNLTDEQLLNRASHAGRNLTVLASLATLASIAFWAIAFMAKIPMMAGIFPALALTLVAAGYCMLALAARRGSPTSVGIVIVIVALQITFVLTIAGISAARAGGDFSSNTPSIIIPILVFIALASSRGVLLELQNRGLWDQAFAPAKPTRDLCIIGGALVALGFITLNGGTFYLGHKVQQERAAEHGQAREFVEMIKHEELQFMTAASEVLRASTSEKLDLALSRAETLKAKCESLRSAAGGQGRLPGVLTTYANAVRQWENGLLALKEKNPDTQHSQRLLDMGDRLRAEALDEFNRYFVNHRSVAQRQ